MNQLDYNPFDSFELSPENQIKVYKENQENPNYKKNPFDELEFSESFWKNAFRTALQIPQGIAEVTPTGLAAGLWQLLGQGEALDPEEVEHIKAISEREGIPFDEDAYMQAAQEALSIIPTIGNIGRGIENKTGIPLEPKTGFQKGTRFASSLGKITPGTAVQKAVGAGTGLATKEGLEYAGVPEPLAELAGFGVGGAAGAKTPEIGVSFSKKKPSGLPERGFERLKETTEVPAKKIQQISDKLEKDFKTVSDKIIKESPIGETAENLKNDPAFKRDSKELLDQTQIIADQTPGGFTAQDYKKALIRQASKQGKGFALGEYEKNYIKYMTEAADSVAPKDIKFGQLVEQYRKNNRSLGEYFEPGASKALNRAKRDALLDQNRAIAHILEDAHPELSKVLSEGNERWTKIMDAETIDNFVNEMFPEGKKPDFKHMKEVFEDPNYQRILKRGLGEEGTKAFENAVEDMLTSDKPMRMLREAKESGWRDVWTTMKAYAIHPHLAAGKSIYDAAKWSYRSLFNATLDKPRVAFNFTRGVNKLKAGDFKAAQAEFSKVAKDVEILEAPKVAEKTKAKTEPVEPIEIKVEPIKEAEAKAPETKKLIGEKPKEKEYKIKTEKEADRSRFSHIKTIEDQNGNFAGELSYDIEPNNEIFLSHIHVNPNLKRQGLASKLFKELLEEHPNKDIVLSRLQPDGAKFFSKIIDKELKPQLTDSYDKIPKISQEPIRLTEKDIVNAKKNLGIEVKTETQTPKIEKQEAKSKRKKAEPVKRTKQEILKEIKDSIKDTKSVISSTKDPKVAKMFSKQLKTLLAEEKEWIRDIKKDKIKAEKKAQAEVRPTKKEFREDKYYSDMIKAYEAGEFKEQAQKLKDEWKLKKENDAKIQKEGEAETLAKMVDINLKEAERLEAEAKQNIKEGRTALAKRKLKRAKDKREFWNKLKKHP